MVPPYARRRSDLTSPSPEATFRTIEALTGSADVTAAASDLPPVVVFAAVMVTLLAAVFIGRRVQRRYEDRLGITAITGRGTDDVPPHRTDAGGTLSS